MKLNFCIWNYFIILKNLLVEQIQRAIKKIWFHDHCMILIPCIEYAFNAFRQRTQQCLTGRQKYIFRYFKLKVWMSLIQSKICLRVFSWIIYCGETYFALEFYCDCYFCDMFKVFFIIWTKTFSYLKNVI